MRAAPPISHVVPTIGVEQLLGARPRCVVDLRSPAEFAADHIPGALNVPLFDDDERAVIGTLYTRVSRDAAFAAGRERARANAAGIVARVAQACGSEPPAAAAAGLVLDLTQGGIDQLERALVSRTLPAVPADAVVLHCWRGGLRSQSVVALLRGLGFERAVGLAGGYKAYRRHVRAELAAQAPRPTLVLRGLTGVGKTLVLRAIERLRPGATLDLEELAGHRSSILGMVGREPRSQKAFESELAARLRALPAATPLVMEGESRKVGDVILPERLWSALQGGTDVLLTAPLERRVQVLLEDYLEQPASRAELRQKLPFIEQRLGPARYGGELVALLDAGRERELVLLLLERYYDPLYRHSEHGRPYAATFDASDPEDAARRVCALLG
jgi:tRNA 2-selenouridine synthase